MRYNTIISPPTLLLDDDDSSCEKLMLMLPRTPAPTAAFPAAARLAARSLEFYVGALVSSCAFKISMPAQASMLCNPSALREEMSDTAKRRIAFVDIKSSVWHAVEHYLAPIRNELPYDESMRSPMFALEWIAWDLYLLILAVRTKSDVAINPSHVITRLDGVLKWVTGAENRLRLANIRAVFKVFDAVPDVPGFRCLPSSGPALVERLNEIVEDAYLLQASTLRRFFGVQANVAAVKRDLRKLLNFISKERRWAKGCLLAGSQTGALTSNASEFADKLLQVFPEMNASFERTPVLLDPHQHRASVSGGRSHRLLSARRLPFYSENWAIENTP